MLGWRAARLRFGARSVKTIADPQRFAPSPEAEMEPQTPRGASQQALQC